jgi:hypothetical protein
MSSLPAVDFEAFRETAAGDTRSDEESEEGEGELLPLPVAQGDEVPDLASPPGFKRLVQVGLMMFVLFLSCDLMRVWVGLGVGVCL